MTPKEKIAVLIERETGLGGKDSNALAEDILAAVVESLPDVPDYDDDDGDMDDAWNDGFIACLEATKGALGV